MSNEPKTIAVTPETVEKLEDMAARLVERVVIGTWQKNGLPAEPLMRAMASYSLTALCHMGEFAEQIEALESLVAALKDLQQANEVPRDHRH